MPTVSSKLQILVCLNLTHRNLILFVAVSSIWLRKLFEGEGIKRMLIFIV